MVKRAVEDEAPQFPKKRKSRHLGECVNVETADFEDIADEVVNAATADNVFRCLEFLRTNKDNDAMKAHILKSSTSKLVASLLTGYQAKRTQNDLATYECLQLLERVYKVNLRPMFPLLWGDDAKEYYEKLRTLGAGLHVRIKPDDVLARLQPDVMWSTVRAHARDESTDAFVANTYDVRFLLRLFASMIEPGCDVSIEKFITCNGLAVTFACTSAKEEGTRLVAYGVLQKFLSAMQELRDDKFRPKPLFVYLLRLFKQSIETTSPRLSNIVAHFFARCSKLLLHPESPVYGPLMAFLCLKPQFDMKNVPELYKFLQSSSTEHHKDERDWLLTLLSEGLIEPMDYNLLQNRSGLKLLQAAFTSCLYDQDARRMILAAFKAAASMPSVAHDLFHRVNFHVWIASVIREPKLTRWEQNYLVEIFVLVITNEREFNRAKVDDPTIAMCSAKIAAKTVLNAMQQIGGVTPVSLEHMKALEEILGKKWRKKRRREVKDEVKEEPDD